MKRLCSCLAFTVILTLSCVAEPVGEFKLCPQCRGKRSLSLTPPNLGQFDGEIGVTPGKPFTTHRWDVKIPSCPICDGTGRVEKYKTRVQPPKPEEVTEYDKCPECRWSPSAGNALAEACSRVVIANPVPGAGSPDGSNRRSARPGRHRST